MKGQKHTENNGNIVPPSINTPKQVNKGNKIGNNRSSSFIAGSQKGSSMNVLGGSKDFGNKMMKTSGSQDVLLEENAPRELTFEEIKNMMD